MEILSAVLLLALVGIGGTLLHFVIELNKSILQLTKELVRVNKEVAPKYKSVNQLKRCPKCTKFSDTVKVLDGVMVCDYCREKIA
jgi:formylmethanofuran dehydrogenase subunit E